MLVEFSVWIASIAVICFVGAAVDAGIRSANKDKEI